MKRVIVESPYAGDIARNVRYACAAVADCLRRGEAPFASHLIYTRPGVYRDEIPEERKLGIEAGFAWREVSELTVFYEDLGWSNGMKLGLEDAQKKNHPYEIRRLGENWEPKPCQYCDGRGEGEIERGGTWVTCSECGGTGKART